jgi:hypothetical protein
MRRWHSERNLMIRRWRQELAKHNNDLPFMALAPPSLAPETDCHCAHGIGSVRKRKPYDCGNPRCGVCHFEKFHVPKARQNVRQREIEFALL